MRIDRIKITGEAPALIQGFYRYRFGTFSRWSPDVLRLTNMILRNSFICAYHLQSRSSCQVLNWVS